MNKLLFICCFCYSIHSFAQNFEVEATVEATGIFSSEDEDAPFWFFTNTNAAVTPQTSFSSTAEVSASYTFKNESFLNAGVAAFYRDGIESLDNFQRRDLYLQYQNNWLKVIVGAKKQDEVFKGLSTTNKNFLWSGNTRPLPGLVLKANNPITFLEKFSIDWGIGHYQLNDDRYVDDVRVHYKHLALTAQLNQKSKLTARIQHFAQWAGTSPDFGELPSDFNAFVDVFFARKPSDDTVVGEVKNVLGNHLGSYFFEYELKTTYGNFSVYHDHPFEDGSGTRFANFPDGIWGITLALENHSFLSHILYEYVDSSDQSGNNPSSGFDGYFGNNLYRSGWSYEDRVLGLPFIVIDPTIELTTNTSQYVSNRSKVHHIGFAGNLKKIDWSLKSTFATFLGTYRQPFEPKVTRWSNYASAMYATEAYGSFKVFAGADKINEGQSNFGGGLTYSYNF